jgi:hypothetical protein
MAIAPSPTANATRFVLSARTSPAANTLGLLVSGPPGAPSTVLAGWLLNDGPVHTKPFSSDATLDGSQSVWGVAPMNT